MYKLTSMDEVTAINPTFIKLEKGDVLRLSPTVYEESKKYNVRLLRNVYDKKKWWQYIIFWIKPKIIAYDVMWAGAQESGNA